MKRLLGRLLLVVVVLVACVPPALILTIALMPLWSWVEESYGIESVGHSGPADWCFVATYVVVLCLVGASWLVYREYRGKMRP